MNRGQSAAKSEANHSEGARQYDASPNEWGGKLVRLERRRRVEFVTHEGHLSPRGRNVSEESMPNQDSTSEATAGQGAAGSPVQTVEGAPPGPVKDVPVDWEALEDAFENNAPEVHSYLHLGTGDVLRIVDGVADPQMHARIAADVNYLRIDPVSSREQYRWMERYIPMVEDAELQRKLTQAIDGKGAFRRFKDVLMAHAPERERWFSFRSERLRIFMEAWLSAHALAPVARPAWPAESAEAPPAVPVDVVVQKEEVAQTKDRRGRNAESLRRTLREIGESLGPRDLDTLVAFAEFVRARRATRAFVSSSVEGEAKDDDASEAPSE